MAFRRHRAGDEVAGRFGRAAEDRDDQNAPPKQAPTGDKAREKLMALAVKILAARPRSEQQLRERLLARPWADPSLVDECIARLKKIGYVNDERFAHSYAAYRVGARPVGKSRLARELATKKVARQTISDALDTVFEEVSEESLIDRAIEKRVRTHGRPADRAAAKRMFDHLVRLGFDYDLIMRKMKGVTSNE